MKNIEIGKAPEKVSFRETNGGWEIRILGDRFKIYWRGDSRIVHGDHPTIHCRTIRELPKLQDISGISAVNQQRWEVKRLQSSIVNRQSSIRMAERVGFEPTEQGLPIHTLSKRAP